jgi:hypothetical protein
MQIIPIAHWVGGFVDYGDGLGVETKQEIAAPDGNRTSVVWFLASYYIV